MEARIEGQKLTVGGRVYVNVEAAFQEGVVVSFTDSGGVEYRGVLLQQSSSTCARTGSDGNKYDMG